MKISQDATRITFKSVEPWFTKEKTGYKTNTVRRIDECLVEDSVLRSSLFNLIEIEIIEPATKQSFVRLLSDVSYFDHRYIFSWRHDDDV